MSFLESSCDYWLTCFIKKVMSQGYTTEESNYSFDPYSFVSQNTEMYSSRKRSRSNSYASGSGYRKRGRMSAPRRSIIPRSLNSRSLTQRAVHPLTGEFQFGIGATDNGIAFSFDTLGAYINSTTGGSLFQSISGLTELSGVYEILRLAKIEFTVLASFNALDLAGISAGTPLSLPIIQIGPDYNDNDVPTKIIMNQNPLATTHRLDKVIRKTVYPKMEGSNGVIDVGVNQRNLFQQAGVASTQQWHGMKFFIDGQSGYSSATYCTISFKCFFEGMYPK